MTIREARRQAAIDQLADEVLARGLRGSSLKALASGLGTSDRMLLYYFDSKDELLALVLEAIAARMTKRLDAAVAPDAVLSFEALLETVWSTLASEALRPYMSVWIEVAAAASRGVEPHRTVAGLIVDGFVGWGFRHLDVEDQEERIRLATLMVATIDGLLLLDGVGRADAAEQAAREATRRKIR